MRPSRSLFDSFRRLSRRERLFVVVGGVVSALALLAVLVVLPMVERWRAREETYAAHREQLRRLQGLVASEPELRRAVTEQRKAQRASARLLVPGATPALAASAIQLDLQRYADESFVELNRVDVAGEPRPEASGLLAIPVMLQAQGDVYGLVDFLHRLQHGGRLFVVQEVTINARPTWMRGDRLLNWSIRGHGLYAPPGGKS